MCAPLYNTTGQQSDAYTIGGRRERIFGGNLSLLSQLRGSRTKAFEEKRDHKTTHTDRADAEHKVKIKREKLFIWRYKSAQIISEI